MMPPNVEQLCAASPGNAVVIPWSWGIRHLPAILHSRQATAQGVTDQGKFAYCNQLLALASGFSKMVERIEREIRKRDMRFHSSRRTVPLVILRRRNSDYLATIAMNLGNWPNIPRGFSSVWTQLQSVS